MDWGPVLFGKTRAFLNRVWSQVPGEVNHFHYFSDNDHGRPHHEESQQENLETLCTPIILLCKMCPLK